MPPELRSNPCTRFSVPSRAPLLLGALLPLITLGCSDQKLGVVSRPPAVTITAPTPGTVFYEGQNIEFQALVEPYDSGEDVTSITHRWVSGNETLCEDEPVNADGYGECDAIFSVVGLKTVQVTVTDQRRDRAQATVEIEIVDNTPPDIEILSPDEDDWFATDELVVFEALVSDQEEDPQNLDVVISSNINGDLGATARPDSSGEYQGAVLFPTPGQHLVTLRVADSYGQSAQDSITLNIYEHGPPSADTVRITPNPAYTSDTLYAEVAGWEDLDGFEERYRFEWFITEDGDTGGSELLDTSETTDSFPSGKTRKGDLLRVVAYPRNDYGEGDPVSSATLEIQNSPPSAPVVSISPLLPQPEDNLRCQVDSPSADDDLDPVTYLYTWYRNGALTAEATSIVASSLTSHGDTWECVVTPFDGEDTGAAASAAVTVSDATPPAAPTINTPTRYTNDEQVTLTGSCEAGCALTLYCADSSTSWTDAQTCTAAGTFSYTDVYSRGVTTSCYGECMDAAGNLSAAGNTVNVEVCDPEDIYEDTAGYGDTAAAAVTGFGTLADSGTTTVSIEGNIVQTDTVDWYVISTSDDVAADRTAGLDYYRFQVQMLSGTATYQISVYKGGYSVGDQECSSSTGITEYEDRVADVGDGSHTIPSETRACGNANPLYNDCEDMSNDYYIKVERRSATVSSCQGYELEITNGVW